MGYKLRRELVGRTRATHLRLLVYMALADAANDEDHKLFGTMEAWPSQGRLAWELNSSRRAIGRALAELEAAGEIRDTGRKKGRGCVIYELTPPEPKAPYDASAEYPAPTPKSATVAGVGVGAVPPTPILAPPTPILETPPTPIPATEPTPRSATEPEGEPEVVEPEGEHSARTEARESGLSPCSKLPSLLTAAQVEAERAEDLAELATLESQLATSAFPEGTERAIVDLRQRLGLAEGIAA